MEKLRRFEEGVAYSLLNLGESYMLLSPGGVDIILPDMVKGKIVLVPGLSIICRPGILTRDGFLNIWRANIILFFITASDGTVQNCTIPCLL